MTSNDAAGDKPFQSSIHTASGTLTACTTTQNTYSTSRTSSSGSAPADDFIGTLFNRTTDINSVGTTYTHA